MPSPLGSLTAEDFLTQYWQKKPVCIRKAFPDFQMALTPQDLASMACDEDMESRIVVDTGQVDQPWELVEGPFQPDIFQHLNERPWSLLVQEVDHVAPEMAALKRLFRFIPDWRMDDVMVSFASDAGSVGPHVDHYDVFLVQGKGKKRWQIESQAYRQVERLEGAALQIVADFRPDEEWVLEEGDLLYLPPGYAHHGVSLGEGMTCSVGFRAPSHSEIFIALGLEVPGETDESLRYADPDLKIQAHPAEISAEALEKVYQILSLTPVEEEAAALAFGRLVTETRLDFDFSPVEVDLTQMRQFLVSAQSIVRADDIRLAYLFDPEEDEEVTVFLNGKEFFLSDSCFPAVQLIAGNPQLSCSELHPFLGQDEFIEFFGKLVAWDLFRLV